MGTKSSSKVIRYPWYADRYQSNNGHTIVDGYSNRTCNRVSVGTSNRNWKDDVKSGRNATTVFSASEGSVTFRTLAYSADWHSNFNGNMSARCYGIPPGIPVEAPHSMIGVNLPLDATSAIDEANAKAIKALYKKIREVHSQFAGGLFLAELRKTVTMIRKPALALRKLVKQTENKSLSIIRKNKGKMITRAGRKEVQTAIAGSYLEGVFGWAPLISDIKDAAVAFARLQGEYRHERFRAFGLSEDVTHSVSSNNNGFDLPVCEFLATWKQVATVVYYGSFQGHSPDVKLGATAERIVGLSGFDWRSFIPTVWEVIPYSFLVDYFVNIGDMLEAATTDTSLVKRLSKVVITEYVFECKFAPSLGLSASYIYGTTGSVISNLQQAGIPGMYTAKYRVVSRAPQIGVPFLTPRFEVPGIFSKHSLNIGALLAGARPARL